LGRMSLEAFARDIRGNEIGGSLGKQGIGGRRKRIQ